MNADKTRGTVAYPLKGTAHTLSASADGAYWDYVKGGQTSSVYDSTIYLSIDYIGKNLTEQIYGVMMSTTKVKQITAALVGVGTKALAVKALVAIGYSTKLASAITICAGFIGKYTLGITNFAKPIQSKEFNDAINQKKGVVHVYYKYSISGTWYYNDSYDVWDTFPVAKEPLTGFGEGDFHTGIRP